MPDGRSLLFLSPDNQALWLVDRTTGKARRVARLPEKYTACTALADYPAGHHFAPGDLDLHEDGDFVVDASGKVACLHLMDRNANMMNVGVDLRVDLVKGAVSHLVSFPEECAKGRRFEPCRPRAPASARQRPAGGFPFALEAGRLRRQEPGAGPRTVAVLGPGFEPEKALSPSGRWLPFHGPIVEGDYIHRPIFLLDRLRGDIYAIRAGPARPLGPARLKRLAFIESFDATGETTIRWLPGIDRLILGSLLVIPGARAIELDGDLAL
jgi:hypothetical protein